MTEKGSATSVDVARRAGVSQSAVSLVFGGKSQGRVGKRTEQAIRRAARELAYTPHTAARSLRSGHSRLVVLAVPDIENPYFAGAFKGAEQEARLHGYAVTLGTVREKEDWQPVILDALWSNSVDGFLLFAMLPPGGKERRSLRGKAVIVDASTRGFPSVGLDVENGMRAAVSHLRELGHRRIAHLAAAVAAETFAVRRKAYREALSAAGLVMQDEHERDTPFSMPAACDIAREMLGSSERPTAIVCDSDVLAAGVYKAARSMGFDIPRDVSVVGFDDGIIARILEPELTTVAIPAAVIGRLALRLLVEVLRGSGVPRRSMVPLDLVIRKSTARPGAK